MQHVNFSSRTFYHCTFAFMLLLQVMIVSRCHINTIYYGDESALVDQARHVIHNGHWFFSKTSDEFIPATYISSDGSHYCSRYPPGKIVLVMLADLIAGDACIFWLNRCEGIAGLALFYLLLLELYPPLLALLGGALLMVLPPYAFFMATCMTQPGSMVSIILTLYLTVRGLAARSLPLLGVAGLVFGSALMVRYDNASLLWVFVTILVVPAWFHSSLKSVTTGSFSTVSRRIAVFLIGFSIVAGCLLCYHWLAFGRPLTTGYALAGEQASFRSLYFKNNLSVVVGSFLLNGEGLAVTAIAALILLLMRKMWGAAALWCFWSLLYPCQFCFYFGFGDVPSVYNGRFIMNSFLPVIFLTLELFVHLRARFSRKWLFLPLFIVLSAHAVLSINAIQGQFTEYNGHSRPVADLVQEINENPGLYKNGSSFFAPGDLLTILQGFYHERFRLLKAPTANPRAITRPDHVPDIQLGAQNKELAAREGVIKLDFAALTAIVHDPERVQPVFIITQSDNLSVKSQPHDSDVQLIKVYGNTRSGHGFEIFQVGTEARQ